MSFTELLHAQKEAVLRRRADPWMATLESLKGKIGPDRIERITTQAIYDFLNLSRSERTPSAARRLAAIMREAGWSSTRLWGINQKGTRDQVRGYARFGIDRDKKGQA